MDAWRGRRGASMSAPWPSRVEAFMTACAMHAGQREADFAEFVRGTAQGLEEAARKQGRGF